MSKQRRLVVTALVLPVALAALAAAGCGRAAPRVSSVVRTEGDRVLTTNLEYDEAGHPSSVERLEGDEEDPRDVAELTWEEGLLTQIVRIVSFDGFSVITTTDITYDERDQPVGSVAKSVRVRDDAEEGDEPDEVSEEIITVTYDRALVETLERRFEDDDRNRASALLTFTYDVTGLVAVAEDVDEENNDGRPDVELSRVTSIEYAEGRPAKLSVSEDEDRPLVMDVAYDGDALDEIVLAIPALDDANNEFIAEGKVVYERDADDRIDAVTFESELAETVTIEIAYEDVEEDAADIDTMPAGVVQLPLWDLRGQAYDTIDARTQVVRLLGASW